MAKKNPTTVHLTPIAEKILEKEAPLLGGIKPILSAGLVLLGKLSGDEQKKAIGEAQGIKGYEIHLRIEADPEHKGLLSAVQQERKKRQAYEKLFKQILAIPNLSASSKDRIQALQKNTRQELRKSAQNLDSPTALDSG